MTKKDYILFAKMFRSRRDYLQNCLTDLHFPETLLYKTNNPVLVEQYRKQIELLDFIISDTADIFASDNYRFDRQKFLQACGEGK